MPLGDRLTLSRWSRVVAQKVAQYINPVLAALKELGGSARPGEVYSKVAEDLALSDSVRDETRKDGRPVFENEIAWARLYLVETGYLDKSRRGVWSLTEKGRTTNTLSDRAIRELLREAQNLIRSRSLAGHKANKASKVVEDAAPVDDEEAGDSYRQRLLDLMMSLPPSGFERLCQRLLRESGFDQVTFPERSAERKEEPRQQIFSDVPESKTQYDCNNSAACKQAGGKSPETGDIQKKDKTDKH
jgi:restriction system protein